MGTDTGQVTGQLQPHDLVLTRTADKCQRKLDKPLRKKLLDALKRLCWDPQNLGEQLKTPLQGVYSHHIKYQGREFRIAYTVDPLLSCITILLIGPHENFYRKLKQVVYAS